MSRYSNLPIILLLSFALTLTAGLAFGEIPADEIQMIKAAAPAKASVQPAKTRKMLVFNLCKGYKHSSIPYVAKALETIGSKTGAFVAVQSDDMAVFSSEQLSEFDAVCFNNTTKLSFSESQKKALMDFVKGGKGIVGIHATTDNFYDWPEAADMMGGQFISHPWRAGGTWAVKIDEPDHPLTKSFKGKGFKIKDEIYLTRPTLYSRTKQRVLMSLDMTDQTTKNAKDHEARDKDIGISWIKYFGKGRIFYCSLGHNKQVLWNEPVLAHYLAGIQFAMGDLNANHTSSVDALMSQIADYDYAENRQALVTMDEYLQWIGAFDEENNIYEGKFTELLMSSQATMASKQYICHKLSRMGSKLSVPVLSTMLLNNDTAEMARFALERIPYQAADKALLGALDKISGNTKIGVINSLGVRKYAPAIDKIGSLIDSKDKITATAAVSAVSNIGGGKALNILKKAQPKSISSVRDRITEALLDQAQAMLAEGKTDEAMAIYKTTFESDKSPALRSAALRGMAMGFSTQEITDIFKQDDLSAINTVIMQRLRGPRADTIEILKLLSSEFLKLSQAGQIRLLNVLADIKNSDFAFATATQAVQSRESGVRFAAFECLGKIGRASSVNLLARKAAHSKGAEQRSARQALLELTAKYVDKTIVIQISASKPKIQAELIKAAGQRKISDATDALLKTAESSNKNVKLESIKALRTTAQAEDLSAFLAVAADMRSRAFLSDTEKTIALLALMKPAGSQRTTDVINTINSAGKNIGVKVMLYHALGRIGDDSGLDTLYDGLTSTNKDVRLACCRILGNWSNPAPADALAETAEKGNQRNIRILALRGYINMASLKADKDQANAYQMYKKAMMLCSRDDEKKLVLSGLSKIHSPDALKFVMEYLEQGSLKSEAKTACMAIAIAVRSSHPDLSDQAFEKIENIFGIKQISVAKGGETIVSIIQCSLTKPMQLETDKNGVLYMIVPNGLGYKMMDPGQGGQAILHFTAEDKGTVKMQFEINGSDIDNDSWHLKLDENTFVTWNDNVTSGWEWKNFNKEYMIEKGRHVLIINQREDGSKMSSIKLILE